MQNRAMDETDRYAFVDFSVVNEAGLSRLERVIAELARQKKGDAVRAEDFWLQYFTECDRNKFWWPSENQLEFWNKFWFSTPLPQRHSPEMPAPNWDFGSMIDAILDGEYGLVGVRKFDAETARLEIDPYAYPYGRNGCVEDVGSVIWSYGYGIRRRDRPRVGRSSIASVERKYATVHAKEAVPLGSSETPIIYVRFPPRFGQSAPSCTE
jgi:hypothetical protein